MKLDTTNWPMWKDEKPIPGSSILFYNGDIDVYTLEVHDKENHLYSDKNKCTQLRSLCFICNDHECKRVNNNDCECDFIPEDDAKWIYIYKP